MKKILRFSPLILLLIIFSCKTTNNQNNREITTSISTDKTIYKIGEPIFLTMKVENLGKKKFTFLPWGTPIENTLTRNCLEVKFNGRNIDYSGIMVKRMPPTKDDYITLKKKATIKGKISISEGYSTNEKGIYSIQFKGNDKSLPTSNTIKVEIK